MPDEQTLLHKVAEHWMPIVGGMSTLIGGAAMIRHRIKTHYQNPHVRLNDMMLCRDDLDKGIKQNEEAIRGGEKQVTDAFEAHNEADRKRYENLLFVVAGMQNGRGED